MSDRERIRALETEVATLREMLEVYEETTVAQAERLDRLVAELRRSNADLDQFAYAASHDLKAPLRGIGSLVTFLAEDMADSLTPDSRAHISALQNRIQRMESLINGMLEFSRVGRVKGAKEMVDTGVLARTVVDLLAPPPHITVVVEDGMPVVLAERVRLQQVLLNLVSNALKYHDKPKGRVRVACEDAGEMWRFVVEDDGPGIAPEYHERIFGMFQRLHARDTIEGTGLGLTLVRRVVELSGGRVTVESDLGKGARFTFTWPKDVTLAVEEKASAGPSFMPEERLTRSP